MGKIKVPTFDEVMGNDSKTDVAIPSFDEVMGTSKKKVGGNGLKTRSPTQSQSKEKPELFPAFGHQTEKETPIIQPLVFTNAQQINKARKAYQDGTMTGEDIGVLSNTEFGRQKGFTNIKPDDREIAAKSYNVMKAGDISNG